MKFKPLIFIFIIGIVFSCSRKLSENQIEDATKNSGFIPHKDSMLTAVNPELDIYNISSGETIADIGYGTAWLPGIILLKYDSLTFFANEIDNYAIRRFEPRINKFLELREKPNTHKINHVKGKKQSTNLTKNTFDKVIVRETFHHFSNQDAMLHDIWKILKPDGKLYIHEPLVDSTYFLKAADLLFIPEKIYYLFLKRLGLIFSNL